MPPKKAEIKQGVLAVKKCNGCRRTLPLKKFPRKKDGKYGRAGRCTQCERERTQKWWDSLSEEERQEKRRQYAANSNQPTPEDRVRHRLKSRYGITVDEYDAFLEDQDGVCAICGLECSSGRLLAVDHNHETGEVRGLLCGNCNRGLGLFKDDPVRLRKAVDYLCQP